MAQEQQNFISYCQSEREKFIRRFTKKPRDVWERVMAEDVVICMDNMINELRKYAEQPANN